MHKDPEVSHLHIVRHPEDHGDLKGTTNFLGVPLPTGQVWKIKGKRGMGGQPLTGPDTVVQQLGIFAQKLMANGPYSNEDPPDPMALFRLPNEVQSGSNVFAFQKSFGNAPTSPEGRWGFDIYYESVDGSEEQGLGCE